MSVWEEVDGWPFSSSLQLRSPSGKRTLASNGLSRYQARQLQGERHDGRSIPSRLYRYRLEGRLLEKASHKRARHVIRRTQQHLRVVSSQLNGSYKSMTPFSSSIQSGTTPDTAVHVEHGLVYRVIRLTSGAVHSSLLYSFYTPLDFLDFRVQQLVCREKQGDVGESPNDVICLLSLSRIPMQ